MEILEGKRARRRDKAEIAFVFLPRALANSTFLAGGRHPLVCYPPPHTPPLYILRDIFSFKLNLVK